MSPNKEEYPANLNATLVLIYSGSAIARARSVINDLVKTRKTLCAKACFFIRRARERIPAEILFIFLLGH